MMCTCTYVQDGDPLFQRSNHIVGKATIYDMAVDPIGKHILTAGQDKFLRYFLGGSTPYSQSNTYSSYVLLIGYLMVLHVHTCTCTSTCIQYICPFWLLEEKLYFSEHDLIDFSYKFGDGWPLISLEFFSSCMLG